MSSEDELANAGQNSHVPPLLDLSGTSNHKNWVPTSGNSELDLPLSGRSLNEVGSAGIDTNGHMIIEGEDSMLDAYVGIQETNADQHMSTLENPAATVNSTPSSKDQRQIRSGKGLSIDVVLAKTQARQVVTDSTDAIPTSRRSTPLSRRSTQRKTSSWSTQDNEQPLSVRSTQSHTSRVSSSSYDATATEQDDNRTLYQVLPNNKKSPRNFNTKKKSERSRRSREEREIGFMSIFPEAITKEFPLKSLMRCFGKHGMSYVRALNEEELREAYKQWRAMEANQRKELRQSKKRISLNPNRKKSSKILNYDDSLQRSYDAYDDISPSAADGSGYVDNDGMGNDYYSEFDSESDAVVTCENTLQDNDITDRIKSRSVGSYGTIDDVIQLGPSLDSNRAPPIIDNNDPNMDNVVIPLQRVDSNISLATAAANAVAILGDSDYEGDENEDTKIAPNIPNDSTNVSSRTRGSSSSLLGSYSNTPFPRVTAPMHAQHSLTYTNGEGITPRQSRGARQAIDDDGDATSGRLGQQYDDSNTPVLNHTIPNNTVAGHTTMNNSNHSSNGSMDTIDAAQSAAISIKSKISAINDETSTSNITVPPESESNHLRRNYSILSEATLALAVDPDPYSVVDSIGAVSATSTGVNTTASYSDSDPTCIPFQVTTSPLLHQRIDGRYKHSRRSYSMDAASIEEESLTKHACVHTVIAADSESTHTAPKVTEMTTAAPPKRSRGRPPKKKYNITGSSNSTSSSPAANKRKRVLNSDDNHSMDDKMTTKRPSTRSTSLKKN